MGSIAVFVAEGFEEMELIIPVDLWRRAQLPVKLVGLHGQLVRGSHGIEVVCSTILEQFLQEQPPSDLLFLPGGLPGSRHLAACGELLQLLGRHYQGGGWVAAICAAAALVTSAAGLLDGRKFTCYPGFEQQARSGEFCPQPVVRSQRLITARAAGDAAAMAAEVLTVLGHQDRAGKLLAATFFTPAS